MKTLYVSDLDGTLLSPEGVIPQQAETILRKKIENGLLFTYATARSLSSAAPLTRNLPLSFPVITHNGAVIVDPQSKVVLFSVSFSKEETKTVFQKVLSLSLSPLVYAVIEGEQKVSFLADQTNPGLRHYLQSRRGDPRLRPVSSMEALFEGEIFYFTIIHPDREALLPLASLFSADPRFCCLFQQELYRTEYWLELMPAAASKGKAIERLKNRFQIDKVVAFGDRINDLSLFEAADYALAVENADEALKRKANEIIPSCAQGGVALWLKQNT